MRTLSIIAPLAFLTTNALAQNIIDFHAQIENSTTTFFDPEPGQPESTSQRHAINIRIDTDAPPIFETASLTRFSIEVISWDFWDSILPEFGYLDTSTPPFSSDGQPSIPSIDITQLTNINAFLQVQGSFWFISVTGLLDIDDPFEDIVTFRLYVRNPFPDFAIGIDTLPDDPSLYASSDYTTSTPIRISTSVADYEADAQWPPSPSFGNTPGTLAWSSRLYTEPQPTCEADINGDGVLNFFDISAYISSFQNGCP